MTSARVSAALKILEKRVILNEEPLKKDKKKRYGIPLQITEKNILKM